MKQWLPKPYYQRVRHTLDRFLSIFSNFPSSVLFYSINLLSRNTSTAGHRPNNNLKKYLILCIGLRLCLGNVM